MLGQLVNRQIIVKNSIAKSALFDVLHILPKQKMRHLTVTVRQRPPAFDQHIALRQGAAERDGRELVINEKFVEIVLVVSDRVLPRASLEDPAVALAEAQLFETSHEFLKRNLRGLQLVFLEPIPTQLLLRLLRRWL
jgi:hypothetical protein